MSKTCCFISFSGEQPFSYRERERLEFTLNGILFYLTFAKDVGTFLFPYSGEMPAIANRVANRIAAQGAAVRNVLALPKGKARYLPFSFYVDKSFDGQEDIAPESASLPLYYREMIDRADYCVFYFDKDCVAKDEKDLFIYAKNSRKNALNLFPSEDILFNAMD